MLDDLLINGGNSAMITEQVSYCLFSHAASHIVTGKTLYLYFYLIQSLISGIGCLFHIIEGPVYHLGEFVAVLDEWSGEPIIAFCSGDGTTSKLPQFVTQNGNIQIIAASSPNSACKKCFDKVEHSL